MKIARLTYDDATPDIEVEKQALGSKGTLEYVFFSEADQDVEKLIHDLQPYDAILNDYVPLTRPIIERLSNCKVISMASSGYTAVDAEAAADNGMYVCAIGEYCTQEVADHTLTLLMALQRRLTLFNNNIQNKKVWDWLAAPDIERLEGQTVGILGLGKIGQAVASRARAFGLNIIAYDPYLPPEVAAKLGIPLKTLDELFAESDYISIHMSVDDSNKGFLDYDKFRKMKKHPFIINVSRGAAVEEPDLVRALDEGLVKGAALDVLSSESPDLENNPLVGRDNVILTPHVAFYSRTSMYLCCKISMDNIIDVFEGNLDKVNRIVARPKK